MCRGTRTRTIGRDRLIQWGRVIVVASLAFLAEGRAATPIVVSTDKGPVAGLLRDGVWVFTGIPYAAPPIGRLRFSPPQQHLPWTRVIDATHEAPACPQTSGSAIGKPSENEDCLYLNVWAPHGREAGLLPVMVWIHGSGDKGYGGSPFFDGFRLARANGVVIVTINYRLGLLGSLVSRALDAADGSYRSGNYHLRDQQEALRWVQRNIGAFGGDPHAVTVFGESAGGAAVLALLASPASRGLFQRAISESPVDPRPSTRASAERRTHDILLPKLGCSHAANLADCLRSTAVKAFLDVPDSWGYVQDDQLLPMDALAAFESGAFVRVPVLIGSNAEEGRFQAALSESSRGRRMTATDYRTDIEGFAALPWLRLDPTEAVGQYPSDHFANPALAESHLVTDMFFACVAGRAREGLSKYVGVYGYEFTEEDPVQEEPLPAITELGNAPYHTSEEAYVFDGDHSHASLTGRAAKLSALMRSYWTTFARRGDPNGGNRSHWPAFDNGTHQILALQDRPVITTDFLRRHHCSRRAVGLADARETRRHQ